MLQGNALLPFCVCRPCWWASPAARPTRGCCPRACAPTACWNSPSSRASCARPPRRNPPPPRARPSSPLPTLRAKAAPRVPPRNSDCGGAREGAVLIVGGRRWCFKLQAVTLAPPLAAARVRRLGAQRPRAVGPGGVLLPYHRARAGRRAVPGSHGHAKLAAEHLGVHTRGVLPSRPRGRGRRGSALGAARFDAGGRRGARAILRAI